MSRWSPDVQRCSPEARASALRILYRRIPEALRPALIAEVLDEADRGLVDLSGLWVARERSWGALLGWDAPAGRITGALLTQALAGRAAAVWAPEVEPSAGRGATAAALVRSALADLRARGFRVAQAVLDESAGRHGALDLARGGLPRVTDLLYMERDTRIPLPAPAGAGGRPSPPPAPALRWRPFSPAHEAEFRASLKATYASSLDMPELEGVRLLDDIIEGHRAAGRFVPDRWQAGRVEGEPEAAAVLLLSAIPEQDAWEVVYLGLTPAARSRGLGRAVIQHALALARPHASRLELAVDVRNRPATRLYNSSGFVAFDRRSVHLVVFPGPVADRHGGT